MESEYLQLINVIIFGIIIGLSFLALYIRENDSSPKRVEKKKMKRNMDRKKENLIKKNPWGGVLHFC